MKRIPRIVLGLALIVIMLSCTLSSNIPSILPSIDTSTPSVTPTPAPTSTPAPTYTPIPSVQIENADKAFFNGDIEGATTGYRAAYADSSDPTIKAAALWGLARAEYTDGRNADVLATLQQLNSNYPNSPFAKVAATTWSTSCGVLGGGEDFRIIVRRKCRSQVLMSLSRRSFLCP